MKENKYDDTQFFEKYSSMQRSKEGLSAAGEWETLSKMLPSFTDKCVLDIGCGYGWHAIYAANNGAREVIATDISSKMLEVAQQKNAHRNISYVCQAFEDSSFASNKFDIIIASLMLHYLDNFTDFVTKVKDWLKPCGTLAFTVEHPVFTAFGSQDWHYSATGEKLHFPVDNYFCEGSRQTTFLGEQVTKYHRTLTSYLDTLLTSGFIVKRVVEPQPPAHLVRKFPELSEELRRPMMLIVVAEKV